MLHKQRKPWSSITKNYCPLSIQHTPWSSIGSCLHEHDALPGKKHTAALWDESVKKWGNGRRCQLDDQSSDTSRISAWTWKFRELPIPNSSFGSIRQNSLWITLDSVMHPVMLPFLLLFAHVTFHDMHRTNFTLLGTLPAFASLSFAFFHS